MKSFIASFLPTSFACNAANSTKEANSVSLEGAFINELVAPIASSCARIGCITVFAILSRKMAISIFLIFISTTKIPRPNMRV